MKGTQAKDLPIGWRWAKLGEVLLGIEAGKSFQTTERLALPNELGVLKVSAVTWAEFRPNEAKAIEEDYEPAPRHRVRKNDILITRANTRELVGAVVHVAADYPNRLLSDKTLRLVVDESLVFPDFMIHMLRQPVARMHIEGNATGTSDSMRNISQEAIRAIPLPLPPLPEQKRIAAILAEQMAAVEKARGAAEERLKATKELPAAYLREVFGNEVARAWPTRPLGEVCEITAPLVDPKKEVFASLPHVFGNNIESGMCRLTYLNTAEEDGMISGKYLFKPGNVLYSKLRPYLRKVIVAEFQGLCSADMYPIEVNPTVLDPHFTAWMLLSDQFTKYADEQSRRARMPKLNREQLFAWEAPIPPLSLQRQLIERHREKIAHVETLQKIVQAELDKISIMPAALFRRAFAGEI